MFGLTKREQRWAAEQKAAEAIIPLIVQIIAAKAEVVKAEIEADSRKTQLSFARTAANLWSKRNEKIYARITIHSIKKFRYR
jgi:hypothetical protein